MEKQLSESDVIVWLDNTRKMKIFVSDQFLKNNRRNVFVMCTVTKETRFALFKNIAAFFRSSSFRVTVNGNFSQRYEDSWRIASILAQHYDQNTTSLCRAISEQLNYN